MKEIYRGSQLFVIFSQYYDKDLCYTDEGLKVLQRYCDDGWILIDRLDCPKDLTYAFKFVKFPNHSPYSLSSSLAWLDLNLAIHAE